MERIIEREKTTMEQPGMESTTMESAATDITAMERDTADVQEWVVVLFFIFTFEHQNFPNSKDWVKKDKSGQRVQIATKTTGCRWMGPWVWVWPIGMGLWVWVWPMDMGRRWRSLHSSWNKKKKLATLSRCARRGKLWLTKASS